MHEVDSSGAFATRFKGPSKANSKDPKGKGYCTYCKRPSHRIDECHTLKVKHEKNPATACIALDSTALCAQTQNDEDNPIRLFKLADTLTKCNDLAN